MKIKNYILLVFLFISIVDASFAQNGVNLYTMPAGYTKQQLYPKTCIVADLTGHIYVGFGKIGIGQFNSSTGNWVMYDTTNSPVPDKAIQHLAVDGNNNLWVATFKGLAKFDGANWSIYDSINSGLLSNRVKYLKTTPTGLWCLTARGLCFYNGTTWSAFTTANSGIVNDTISSIDVDSNSVVYISTMHGLSVYDGVNWLTYTTLNSDLRTNEIYGVANLTTTACWVFTSDGWYRLLGGSFINERCLYKAPLVSKEIEGLQYLTKGNDGKLYSFKNNYALSRFDENANVETLIDSGWPDITPVIGNNSKFCFDPAGKLWAVPSSPLQPTPQPMMSLDVNGSTSVFVPFNKNQNSFQRYLDINNTAALITNTGTMFWDMNEAAGMSKYEVPKCSWKTPIFVSTLWIGGYDQSGMLHVAAQTYNQQNYHDFLAGPLDTTNATIDSLNNAAYDNIWKLDRNTIDDFKTNFLNGNVSNGTYPVPYDILDYPAVGTGNYTRNMAPYVDYNSDGNYNPYDGDYPLIKGDQQLFWIFNDVDTSSRESEGIPLGVEVRAYAYAYTCGQYPLGDSNAVLDYTTFYRYEITNRSMNTYDSVYVGLFNDFDLGDATDDYIGCDTVLNAQFVYNSDNNDGTATGYGINPPMFNCQILQGPEPVLNDGIDNDHDGTTDEVGEINMMTVSHYYWSDFTQFGNPEQADDYYEFLTARFKDGSHMTYGGMGAFGDTLTNYYFPGVPYSGNGWTQPSVGGSGSDIRAVASSGPFHLAPGETKSIDFAYVFTWDSTAANGLTTSIARNTADLQRVKYWFDNNNYPSCLNTSIQNIEVKNSDVTIFPNPADDYLNVLYSGNNSARFDVFDVAGRFLFSKTVKSHDKINIRSLTTGMYVIKLITQDKTISKKFIKK